MKTETILRKLDINNIVDEELKPFLLQIGLNKLYFS